MRIEGEPIGDRIARRRRRAERHGHFAEWLAALCLRLKGYRVLSRRYRTKLGEVDLIVRKGEVIAFVEVKARREASLAIDAVPEGAQHRIRAAGDLWLAGHAARGRDISRYVLRYDIVAVMPRRWPRHFPDAF